jgi:hypothetical protein
VVFFPPGPPPPPPRIIVAIQLHHVVKNPFISNTFQKRPFEFVVCLLEIDF